MTKSEELIQQTAEALNETPEEVIERCVKSQCFSNHEAVVAQNLHRYWRDKTVPEYVTSYCLTILGKREPNLWSLAQAEGKASGSN
jgi:hypothetical protein